MVDQGLGGLLPKSDCGLARWFVAPQRRIARSVTLDATGVEGTSGTRPDGLRSVGVEIRSQGAVANEVLGEQTERNA